MAAVSQIPGIGDLDNSPVDLAEDVHLRRKWIRDTDSSYTKLAKAGGRKGTVYDKIYSLWQFSNCMLATERVFQYLHQNNSSKGFISYSVTSVPKKSPTVCLGWGGYMTCGWRGSSSNLRHCLKLE